MNRQDHGARPGADVPPEGGQSEHDRLHQWKYGTSANVRDPSGSRRRAVTAHPPVLRTGAQAASRQSLQLTPALRTQAASSSSSSTPYAAALVPNRESWIGRPPARGSPGTPWAPDPSRARWSGCYDSQAGWGHDVTAGRGSSAWPETSPLDYASGWDYNDGGGGWGWGNGGGDRGAGGVWGWGP